MSAQIFKASNGEIQRPANTIVRVYKVLDIEKRMVNMLGDYMRTTGYSAKYPNFAQVRIGVIHPFAVLLFRTIQNSDISLDLFPSITVSDSSDTRQARTLSESEWVVYSAAEVFQVKALAQNGSVFVSDAGIAAMEAATEDGGQIAGTLRKHYMVHSMDFNIWADNREVVSLLYDLVECCLVEFAEKVGEEDGIDFQGDISGRRSGDVNLDFGTMLYGANITADIGIVGTTLEMDVPIEIIGDIDVQTYPEYHLLGGDDG